MVALFVAILLVALIGTALFAGLAAGAGSPEEYFAANPGTTILIVLSAMLFVIGILTWVWAKIGLAIPIAVHEGGLGIRRAWKMSKGHTGSLFFALIGTYFLMVLLMIAMIIVLGIVAGIILVPLGMLAANTDLTWLVIAVGVVLYIAFYVVLYCVTTAIPTGVFAEAYRLIKGSSAVAETFD